MNGVINLSSTASSSYASMKSDTWKVGAMLTDTYNGRNETITAQLSYGKNKYTDEYINSDELKQLSDMGPFFAASYKLLKVNNCKTVKDLTVTIDDDIEISISIDDAAKCLLALNHLRQLHGTQPSFFAVDNYTQELNKHIHFIVRQKSTEITARGSLLTIMKGSKNEFQPGFALTFKGETKAQSLYENLSEEDLANYNKIVKKINELVDECTTIVETFSSKVKTIAEAFKINYANSASNVVKQVVEEKGYRNLRDTQTTMINNNLVYYRSVGFQYNSDNKPTELEGYYLLVYVNSGSYYSFMAQITLALVQAALLAMIIAGVLSFILSYPLISSTQKLSRFAGRIAKGDFEPVKGKIRSKELSELGDTMNRMAYKLEESDVEQKTFFQNASHELRTPLMSIQGYAEGLKFGVFEDSKSRDNAIDVIIAETERLSGLVENLLSISKMDMSKSGNYAYGA